jgi:hypothetical protein
MTRGVNEEREQCGLFSPGAKCCKAGLAVLVKAGRYKYRPAFIKTSLPGKENPD